MSEPTQAASVANYTTCPDHPYHVCRCTDEDRRVRAAIAALIREHEQGADDA